MSLLLLFLGGHLLAKPAAAEAPDLSLQAQTRRSPSPLTPRATPPAICPAQLGARVDAVINRPEFQRSRWGILVEPLSPAAGQTLIARDRDRYFIPASNAKLLTTAAALHKLTPQFRIRTSVYGTDGGASLRVVGRGDPSLSENQIRALAQQIQRRGINQVQRLIAEDGYFRGQPVNPNWEWEDVQAGYGAPINSLIYNQNAIDLVLTPQALGQPLRVTWVDPQQAVGWQVENTSRTVPSDAAEFVDVGRDLSKPLVRVSGQLRAGADPEPVSVAVIDPATNFLQYFRQALAAQGISVVQAAVGIGGDSAPGERELAAVESPPLSELVNEVNQQSNNLYAEALLRLMGATTQRAGVQTPESSAEKGVEVVKATLTELGVEPRTYVLEDGSGLSRHNLVSPDALVQTLKAMANSPEAEVYRASLPVAGVSGSLLGRFKGTAAAGVLQAKTGTLSGVSALSGYLTHPDYQTLVFSIMVNQSDLSSSTLRQAMDEIVILLTQLRRC